MKSVGNVLRIKVIQTPKGTTSDKSMVGQSEKDSYLFFSRTDSNPAFL